MMWTLSTSTVKFIMYNQPKETIMKTYSQHQDAIRAHQEDLLASGDYRLNDEPPEAFYTWDSLSQIRYINKHGEWLA